MLDEAPARHRRLIIAGASRGKSCRKSFPEKVPKRGLEPPLPLREPGPEPGEPVGEARWCSTRIALDFLYSPLDTSPTVLHQHCRHITLTGPVLHPVYTPNAPHRAIQFHYASARPRPASCGSSGSRTRQPSMSTYPRLRIAILRQGAGTPPSTRRVSLGTAPNHANTPACRYPDNRILLRHRPGRQAGFGRERSQGTAVRGRYLCQTVQHRKVSARPRIADQPLLTGWAINAGASLPFNHRPSACAASHRS
jgi:hypothetical protein